MIPDIIAHVAFPFGRKPARGEKVQSEAHSFQIRQGNILQGRPAQRIQYHVIPFKNVLHFLLVVPALPHYPVMVPVLAGPAAEFPVGTAVRQLVTALEAMLIIRFLLSVHNPEFFVLSKVCPIYFHIKQADETFYDYISIFLRFLKFIPILVIRREKAAIRIKLLKSEKTCRIGKTGTGGIHNPGIIVLLCFRPVRRAPRYRNWNLNRNLMEQLNRIELRGNVGNVRLSSVGDSQVARFSLATNFIYKGREGDAVIETTWHNIVAWSGKGMPDLNKIDKGTPLYVCGRLRSSKFTGSDGAEKQIYEVVANKIAFETPSPMQCGL